MKIYHSGTGNSNESLPASVMKYVTKQTKHFGSIINCKANFTTTVKMISLNRSTCRLVFKNSAFDFRYLHPEMDYFREIKFKSNSSPLKS